MEVLIVGAGALGKCIAGLVAGHANVVLYERDPQTRRALAKGDLTFIKQKTTRKVHVDSVNSPDLVRRGQIDVLIFATKIMDLRSAVMAVADLKPRCIFLPQNGIPDLAWVKREFYQTRICRGVTTMACQESGHGAVRLFYQGEVYVGGEGAQIVAALFRRCGVKVRVSRNSDSSVWAKLIFSSVMNPLPVITGQGYQVLKDDEIWRTVKRAVDEGRAVARSLGVRLAFDPMHLIKRVRYGDLTDIEHRGSIVHDLRAGRPSELDHMTGALIRHARKVGIKTPNLDWILAKARAMGA